MKLNIYINVCINCEIVILFQGFEYLINRLSSHLFHE